MQSIGVKFVACLSPAQHIHSHINSNNRHLCTVQLKQFLYLPFVTAEICKGTCKAGPTIHLQPCPQPTPEKLEKCRTALRLQSCWFCSKMIINTHRHCSSVNMSYVSMIIFLTKALTCHPDGTFYNIATTPRALCCH